MTETTPRLSDEALMARVHALPWWHSITLRPGVVTPGGKSAHIMAEEEAAIFAPLALQGRSVLDIGAWNGGFSFAAKRRGAARVLATDSYIWKHAYWRGREGLELARAELGLDVETAIVDPPALTPEIGIFDVVMFLGVFYHLYDPLDVMERLRGVTRQLLIVETHQDALDDPRPGMVFYPGDVLLGDATNWWGPNPALMLRLLQRLGFRRIHYRDHPTLGRVRGIYAAFTDEAEPSLVAGFDANWTDLTAPGAVDALLVRT